MKVRGLAHSLSVCTGILKVAEIRAPGKPVQNGLTNGAQNSGMFGTFAIRTMGPRRCTEKRK